LAQRIVRAKAKIRDAKIPYAVPEPSDLPERLQSVLRVVYLVFNEGYSASSGEEVQRSGLAWEAIRLAELLVDLLPEPEVRGLLALMLLHESRRGARTSATGDLIPLDAQDRSRWDRRLIERGGALVEESLRSRRFGPYTLQAAISAVHGEAHSYGETDWNEIVGLYQALQAMAPSPVIELNLAVAMAMRDGPKVGLDRVEALMAQGELTDYHLAYAAQAELYQRLGRYDDATRAYKSALERTQQGPERRYLHGKLLELQANRT
jgi:RNA polymerase sigma-70 factor (ECF subfamily)